jgi:hypothetical protein
LAENHLAIHEIKCNWLLATKIEGNTALHLATMRGKEEVLQEIWDLAKNHLTTDGIKKLFVISHVQ